MIVSAIIGALLGWLLHEIVQAPLGWEDDHGFHRGSHPSVGRAAPVSPVIHEQSDG